MSSAGPDKADVFLAGLISDNDWLQLELLIKDALKAFSPEEISRLLEEAGLLKEAQDNRVVMQNVQKAKAILNTLRERK